MVPRFHLIAFSRCVMDLKSILKSTTAELPADSSRYAMIDQNPQGECLRKISRTWYTLQENDLTMSYEYEFSRSALEVTISRNKKWLDWGGK